MGGAGTHPQQVTTLILVHALIDNDTAKDQNFTPKNAYVCDFQIPGVFKNNLKRKCLDTSQTFLGLIAPSAKAVLLVKNVAKKRSTIPASCSTFFGSDPTSKTTLSQPLLRLFRGPRQRLRGAAGHESWRLESVVRRVQ